MNINNETKLGVFAIVVICLLVLGYNYLRGRSPFDRRKKIYAVFNDLGPLSKNNEVKINGFVIGKVAELSAKDKDLSGFVATIRLTKNVNIPANSMAYISSPIMGAPYIGIDKGDAAELIKPGDTLKSRPGNGYPDIKGQLNPLLEKFKGILDSMLLRHPADPTPKK